MAKSHSAYVTTTGAAGSATGSAVIKGALGLLVRIQGNWNASAPGTSDVTIVETDEFGSVTLYTKSDSAADFDFPLYVAAKDNANTALDPAVYVPHALSGGSITISVSGCDALTNALSVKITVIE